MRQGTSYETPSGPISVGLLQVNDQTVADEGLNPLVLLCHKLLPDSNVICHVWRFLTVEAGYGSQVWSAR
jgi:hypothetical protein